MKFTTTDNTTYRAGVGTVPKAWIDYEVGHAASIDKYFYKHIKVWDADVCGDETHDFLFEDGKAFRLEYSWWMEWYHEDDDLNGFFDRKSIEEITVEQADVPSKVQRDWL